MNQLIVKITFDNVNGREKEVDVNYITTYIPMSASVACILITIVPICASSDSEAVLLLLGTNSGVLSLRSNTVISTLDTHSQSLFSRSCTCASKLYCDCCSRSKGIAVFNNPNKKEKYNNNCIMYCILTK